LFAPGQTILHYRIVEKIGEGGMGVVHRARDERLDRDVAIKVLPEDFAADRERLARFEREARLLAALNHANIASIYGFESVDGVRFIAMELVAGETLAARIARDGRLPLDEALDIARQIAEALEAAQASGIVHRDLKPANVNVTPSGTVKVLDFGLAKTYGGGGAPETSESPTVAVATQTGAILGTAPYMSPEQARGRPVDNRTDIWAFGCVLFEMLAGRRAFGRETVSDTLVAVLQEAPPFDDLASEVPGQVRRLLRRALAKDPQRRLQHIGDARVELEEARARPELDPAWGPSGTAARPAPRPWVPGLALAGGIILGVVGTLQIRPAGDSAQRPEPTRLQVAADLSRNIDRSFALSPDGRTLAYVGAEQQLFVRRLDEFEAHPLEGARGARSPFFSPDGAWIGYWADQAIRRIPTNGGPTQRITSAATILGASWTADGRIVFAEFVSPLRIVSAQGGEARDLVAVEPSIGITYSRPHILPGDAGVLFESREGIVLASLETGQWQPLLDDARAPVYSASGHIVFKHVDDTVWAVRFDLETLQLSGEPFPAQSRPARGFAVADNGTFVFARIRAGGDRQLVWVDRDGNSEPLSFEPGPYYSPRLSPDGRQIAVAGNEAIWVLDLPRGTRTRLVGAGVATRWPVWTHGGSRITFTASLVESEPFNLFWRAPGSPSPPERLIPYSGLAIPTSWSERSQELALYGMDGPFGYIDALQPDGTRKSLVATSDDDRAPVFAPEGRRLAYVSNASGRDEVYVVPYPEMEPRLLVSRDGGTEPVWARDGAQLFYRDQTGLLAVTVSTGGSLAAGVPELLFPHGSSMFSPIGRGNANYDAATDGRFLMVRDASDDTDQGLWVVLDWAQELERQPAGR